MGTTAPDRSGVGGRLSRSEGRQPPLQDVRLRAMDPVRLYRLRGPRRRLALHDGSGLWDLSAYLERLGRPNDLVELIEDGWFASAALEPLLPRSGGEGWNACDVAFDGNAPADVDTPLSPAQVGKVLCLGKNFRAHAAEFGEEVPAEPMFFNKLPETLTAHRATVRVPAWYDRRVDHEAELAAVIGLQGKDIQLEDAWEHVGGWTVANDLTARSLQGNDRKLGHPWLRAKNLDGFLPLGPAIVPRDFLDTADVRVTCHVNGELRQDATTADWVVDLPHAIAHLSRFLTLRPGDVILMGTPEGVGPLNDGDHVTCAAAGIGSLETKIER